MIRVNRDISVEDFYQHHKMTLKKEGKVITYSFEYLHNIIEAARVNASVELLSATDNDGIIHSTIIILYNQVSAYYIASSIDSDYRSSGSTTLLIVEAMKIVSAVTNRFDFEGSMIPGVEQSFRRFGTRQVPYFVVYKDGGWKPRIKILLERIARKAGLKE